MSEHSSFVSNYYYNNDDFAKTLIYFDKHKYEFDGEIEVVAHNNIISGFIRQSFPSFERFLLTNFLSELKLKDEMHFVIICDSTEIYDVSNCNGEWSYTELI